MHQDLFLDSIQQLPQEKREQALALLNNHPELLEHLKQNFEKKMAAIKARDAQLLQTIFAEEKQAIEKLTSELQ